MANKVLVKTNRDIIVKKTNKKKQKDKSKDKPTDPKPLTVNPNPPSIPVKKPRPIG